MAEDRNYTITLKIEGSTNAGASSAVAGSSTQSQKQAVADNINIPESHPGLLQNGNARLALATSLVAWNTIKPYITQQINYRVSLVELKTGSREMQEKANFFNQTIQKGVGLAESIGVGSLLGGAPGAVVGAAVDATRSIISYYQKVNMLNLQDTLESRSTELQRIRAASLGSRSNNQ